MANTSASARRWLKNFAVKVHEELHDMLTDPLIVLMPLRRLKVEESDTDGWLVELGHIRGVKGSLQVWFDSYAKANGRRVSVCFASTTKDSPAAVARYAKGDLGQAVVFRDDVWTVESDDATRLKISLPARLYGKPIHEPYERGVSVSTLSDGAIAKVIDGSSA